MKMKQIITFLLLTIVGVAGVKASQQLELTPANGSYATSSGNYVSTLTFSTTPEVTITASANNMDKRQTASYFLWHSGQSLSGTYTIAISDTYLITGYTITAEANSNDQTVTFGSTSATFTSSGETDMTVTGLDGSATSFTLSGSNTGLKVSKIVLTIEENNTYEAPSAYVCTINNTNSNRGALMYAPTQSTKWVWSSGKGNQTFDENNTNCQWVFIESGIEEEYYLYNLGANKFAIPVTDGTYSGYSWAFSNDAVSLKLLAQSGGTYKIKTVNSDIYMAVSNGYMGPIINYNDIGGNFTITKVAELTSNITQQTTAAVNKLIHKTTPLTAAPTGEGWYSIRVKIHGSYPDYFIFTPETEIDYGGTNYALNFYNAAKLRPAIDNPTYYFRIAQDGSGYDWQMPNGRYLYNNSNKFPVSIETATAINVDYSSSGFRFYHNSRYAVPYYLGSTYFVGETSTSNNTYYDIYPIDLNAADLVAWQVLCDDAPASAEITCSRTDVSGLTSVYKNGYFFLPTGVTPSGSDFNLSGGTTYTVDETAHTITIAYDPSLAIVAEGVEVHQGYGTTGLGNEKAVLLRMQVTPFNAMENAVMNFTLTGADNISAVKVYETGNNVEFNAISSYTHTFNGTINGTAATVTLGNVTAGTHYYWLCATVASDATVGDVIDAALTGVTYDYNGYTGTTCDLSAVGNPATSMKIFDKQQYLFLPTTNNSNYYRIPALITTDNGSLIAACDKRYNSSSDLGSHKIDVVMRRSTNGGATWSDVATIAEGDGSSDAAYGYGDPAFVKCASGKIICLMAAGKNSFWQGMSNIAMVISDDDGVTWSSPIDITTNTGHFTNNSSKSDWFVTSGKGLCTSDGVIMFLLDADHNAETNLVLYSVDEGENWIIDDAVVATGANEAKLVELEPGKLLSSTRNPGNRIFNTGAYTKNTNECDFIWDTQTTNSTLNQGGSGNNQDIIVYSRNNDGSAKVLIHTLTTGYGHRTLKLFLSLDKGESWNEVMQVQPGGSRYAVTTILENGDLGILFEDYSLEIGKEYPINFLTITQEQINEWVEELEPVDYDFDANFDKTFIIKNYNSGVNNPYIQSPKYNAAGDVKAYRTADINKSAEMLILKDHQNDGFYYVYDMKSNFYLKGSENTNAGTEWTFSTTPVTVKLTDHTSNHSGWTLTDGHIFLIQNSDGSMANAYEGSYGTQVKNWTDDTDSGSHWYIYATENSTTSAVYVDPTALYYIKNVDNGCCFETGEDGNLTRNTQATAATYAVIPVSGQDGYYYLYDTQAQNFVVSEEETGNGGQWTRSTTTPTAIKIKNNITNQYMDRSAWNPSGIIYLLGTKYANRYGGGMTGLVKNYNKQADKGSHWYLERVDNSTTASVELKGVTENIQLLVKSAAAAQTQLQYTATVGSAGYGTLVIPFNADVTGDVKAYTASKLNGNSIVLNEVTTISANNPVILENQGMLTLTSETGSVAYVENPTNGVLTGVYANTTAEEGTYVLQNQNGKVAFYLVGTDTKPTIRPFRAYLTVPANGAKFLSFSYGEADGISRMENGEREMCNIYDLMGRKVSSLQKGVNIVRKSDGSTKKIIVK